MIEESQLKGWTNLPTAQVCWVINDYNRDEIHDLFASILDTPKKAVKQIKEIALKIGLKIEDIDIPQVLEVFTPAAKNWNDKWNRFR